MISYDDIRDLQRYQSGATSYTLSLFLNVDQSRAANLNRGFETTVESLFRRIAENGAAEDNKQNFESECQRVKKFLNGYVPRGRGLVIFSDSSRGLWWQRDLQVDVPTEARWSSSLWLRPLLEVLEEHERFAVVLIDKQRARILVVDATGVEQQAEFESDVPNRHATTGSDRIWSQSQMDRDHVNHLKLFAKRTADELSAIVDRSKLSRLVIGGPVEATSAFIAELPKRLQQLIIGTVSAPVDASPDRLRNELRELQKRAEHSDEARMVGSMITSAMKSDRAVLGITDTLRAIQEGRVYRMVVAHDFRTEGKQCTACRTLVVDRVESCPFCGGHLEDAPDLINRASHRVLEQAGKVQLVSGEAAAQLSGKGIGALLRF
jgi:peptide chain release factor subunit 1